MIGEGLILRFAEFNGSSVSIEQLKEYRTKVEQYIDSVGTGPYVPKLQSIKDRVTKAIKEWTAKGITDVDSLEIAPIVIKEEKPALGKIEKVSVPKSVTAAELRTILKKEFFDKIKKEKQPEPKKQAEKIGQKVSKPKKVVEKKLTEKDLLKFVKRKGLAGSSIDQLGVEYDLKKVLAWLGDSFTFVKGKPIVFYHGSKIDFNEFDKTKIGSATDAGWLGEGFYFYTEYDQALQYGKVKSYFLKIENPYFATREDNVILSEKNSKKISRKFTDSLKSEGYDGVYYDGDLRGETVAFYPNQIKEISEFEISEKKGDNIGSVSAKKKLNEEQQALHDFSFDMGAKAFAEGINEADKDKHFVALAKGNDKLIAYKAWGDGYISAKRKPKATEPEIKNLSGLVDASALAGIEFKEFALADPYKSDFHKLNSDTQVMIWGVPGSGKTVYELKFAQYLASQLGLKVLFVANEEFGRSTFSQKLKEFNIGHANLKFAKTVTDEMIDQFDVVFFDSINSLGINLDEYRRLRDAHSNKLFVLIVQSTKDGDFRGGKDWEHEVDIAGEIVNRKLILRKNRLDPDNSKKAEELNKVEMINEGKKKAEIKQAVKVGMETTNQQLPTINEKAA